MPETLGSCSQVSAQTLAHIMVSGIDARSRNYLRSRLSNRPPIGQYDSAGQYNPYQGQSGGYIGGGGGYGRPGYGQIYNQGCGYGGGYGRRPYGY